MDSRGHNLYREKIRHMCEENLSSFEVDYNTLAAECSVLAFFLPEAPTEMLQVGSQICSSRYEMVQQDIKWKWS